MSQGWIKLYRQIQDCFLWADKPFDKARAWIDLLLLANHEDKRIMFNGRPMDITRGQYLTSIRKLSDRWGWSYDKTSRFLTVLSDDGMLQKDCDNNRTLLTIVKYEVYQSNQSLTSELTEHSQVNSPNTHKGTDRTLISDKQECKNKKNEKNEKNDKSIKLSFGEFQRVKLTQDEYDRLGKDYGPEKRKQAIKFLDEYIEEKHYKSHSHNLAMRRWVFDAIKDHEPQKDDFFSRLQQAVKEAEDVNE